MRVIMTRWGVLLLLLVGNAAMAQQGGGGEQLFIVPPAGWSIGYHDLKGNTDLTEMVPSGQSMQNWTDLLTVELVQGKPTVDAQTLLAGRLDSIRQGCDNVGAGPPQLAVENGYDTGVRAFACPKSKRFGKGELTLYKVIMGNHRTYIVTRAWSGPPFEKGHMPTLPPNTTEDWLAFMSRVIVCDSNERTHPCPTG
jgi:hypothetical protein